MSLTDRPVHDYTEALMTPRRVYGVVKLVLNGHGVQQRTILSCRNDDLDPEHRNTAGFWTLMMEDEGRAILADWSEWASGDPYFGEDWRVEVKVDGEYVMDVHPAHALAEYEAATAVPLRALVNP